VVRRQRGADRTGGVLRRPPREADAIGLKRRTAHHRAAEHRWIEGPAGQDIAEPQLVITAYTLNLLGDAAVDDLARVGSAVDQIPDVVQIDVRDKSPRLADQRAKCGNIPVHIPDDERGH